MDVMFGVHPVPCALFFNFGVWLYLMIFFPTNSMLSFYIELFKDTASAEYLVNVFA